MKKRFWEYFAETDEDFKELWESAIFVLDTNVLLNFYSYSEEAKEAFLELLRKMEGRLSAAVSSGGGIF
ncbi:MAG: PIN-like domain-containing protein [Trueperaceae bacterium]|nr:PIN-like domain-containing protein [Trueperaceae bacterium]